MRYKIIFSWYTLGGEFIKSEMQDNFHTPLTANRRAHALKTEAYRRGMLIKWSAPVPVTSELPPVVYDGPPVRKHIVFCGNHTECACCGRVLAGTELCKECF